MTKPSRQVLAVITADISGSRNIRDFRSERDKRLKPLARQHRTDGLILSDYAVTAWDEFEGLAKPFAVPTLLLDLRRRFYPLNLWIGVGIGTVSGPFRDPINVFGGGEAFERARKAVSEIKKGRYKSRRMTAFSSENIEFDLIANTMYHLHDTLIQGISAKQWATINAQLSARQQQKTAKRLGLDKSSVSRNLRRGFYTQIEETRRTMRSLLERYFD
jgi:SatD family (SatD)